MYALNNEKFGAFLARLRKEKGLTQKELAEKLFVSDKAVSKWERGLSFPDISLLQPIADIFQVTVTELLSGQHIQADEPMTVKEVDPLLSGALHMSAQDKQAQSVKRRQWGRGYMACLLMWAVSVWFIRDTGYLWDVYAAALWMPPTMAAVFGIHFIFSAKEKLPAFYDQNRLNFYSDGIFRMNLPGIYFNNRNWPHILKATRRWCCITMAGWSLCYAALRQALALLPLPQSANLPVLLSACLGAILGGLFIPISKAGKKYE